MNVQSLVLTISLVLVFISSCCVPVSRRSFCIEVRAEKPMPLPTWIALEIEGEGREAHAFDPAAFQGIERKEYRYGYLRVTYEPRKTSFCFGRDHLGFFHVHIAWNSVQKSWSFPVKADLFCGVTQTESIEATFP